MRSQLPPQIENEQARPSSSSTKSPSPPPENLSSTKRNLAIVIISFLLDWILFSHLPGPHSITTTLSQSTTQPDPRPKRRRHSLSSPIKPTSLPLPPSWDSDYKQQSLIPCIKPLGVSIVESTSEVGINQNSPLNGLERGHDNKHVQFKSPIFSVMTFTGSPILNEQIFSDEDDYEDEKLDTFNEQDMFTFSKVSHSRQISNSMVTPLTRRNPAMFASVHSCSSHDDSLFEMRASPRNGSELEYPTTINDNLPRLNRSETVTSIFSNQDLCYHILSNGPYNSVMANYEVTEPFIPHGRLSEAA